MKENTGFQLGPSCSSHTWKRPLGHKNQGLCINSKLQARAAFLFQHQLLLPLLGTKGVLLAVASLGSRDASLCAGVCVCTRGCVFTLACLFAYRVSLLLNPVQWDIQREPQGSTASPNLKLSNSVLAIGCRSDLTAACLRLTG